MAKPFVGVAFREGTLEWIVQIWLNLISRNLEENRYVLIWTSGTKTSCLNSGVFFFCQKTSDGLFSKESYILF